MPQLLTTPALVNQQMNLSSDKKYRKIFVFCKWQAGDHILMNKNEIHRR